MRRKALTSDAPDYKPHRPWEWCLRRVVEDTAFWRRELEESAMLVLAKASRFSQALDGDALVAHCPPLASKARPAGRGMPTSATHPAASAAKTSSLGKHLIVGEDGMLSTNRCGNRLCEAFQHGTCDESTRRGVCPRDRQMAHQCAKCLSPSHGADSCREGGHGPPQA